MIGPGAAAAAHLEDAQLLRLMDGEGTAAESSAWHAHIAACDAWAGAAARMRGDAAAVAAWLAFAGFEEDATGTSAAAAADGPRPGRRLGVRAAWRAASPLLRAAAVIVLIAAPVAAIPAVRQAAVALLAGARAGDSAERPAHAPGTAPGPAQRTAAAALRFEPAAGPFTITFEAAQAAGTLRLLRAVGREAVLRAESADPASAAGITVAAGSLHLRNAASASAGYVVELPATVSRVIVLVAGRQVAVLEADALPGGVELPIR
jgi:hypothetical protein